MDEYSEWRNYNFNSYNQMAIFIIILNINVKIMTDIENFDINTCIYKNAYCLVKQERHNYFDS